MSVSKISFGNVGVQNISPSQKIVLPMPAKSTTTNVVTSAPSESSSDEKTKNLEEKAPVIKETNAKVKAFFADEKNKKILVYSGIGLLALGGIAYWQRELLGLSKKAKKQATNIKEQIAQKVENKVAESINKNPDTTAQKIEKNIENTIEQKVEKSIVPKADNKIQHNPAQSIEPKPTNTPVTKNETIQVESNVNEPRKKISKHKSYDEQIAALGVTRDSEAKMRPIIDKHRKEANRVLFENIHNRITDLPTIERAANIRSASPTEPEPFHQAASWLEEAYKFAYSRAELKDGKNIFNFIHNRIANENNSLAKMYAQMPLDEAKARLWRFVCETAIKDSHKGMTGEEFFLDVVNNLIPKAKADLQKM